MPWIFRQRAPFKGQVFAEDPDYEKRVSLEEKVRLSRASHGVDTAVGYEVDPAQVPTDLLLERPVKKLMDFFFINNHVYIVSDRFLEVLESLDPDTHQSWPVTFRTKRGKRQPGNFFGLVVKGFGAAISEIGSDLHIRPPSVTPIAGKPPIVLRRSVSLHASEDAAYDPEKLPKHNLWIDFGLTTSYLLSSDKLHAEIVARGLDVFKMKRLSAAPLPASEVSC